MTLQCKSCTLILLGEEVLVVFQQELIETMPSNVPNLGFDSSPVATSTGITEADPERTPFLFVFFKYLINRKRNWI